MQFLIKKQFYFLLLKRGLFMHCPVWIHCCQWSNYDFCISEGSVATTLGQGGQNCRHLRQVSF